MEQPGGLAAKRRVLVDALTMCLSRSKVIEHVDANTLRSVLDSASGEMWREGEFRLDTVWKILTQQPGLTAAEVAPPLLVFKAYEGELGVSVRLPQALAAIPRNEQVRLRDALQISKADFAKSVAELQELARSSEAEKQQAAGVVRAEQAVARSQKMPLASPIPPKQERKPMSRGVAAAVLGASLAILGGTLFFTFRSKAEPADFGDVAPLLKIVDGKRLGTAWTGVIADPRWDKLTLEERQKLANQVFDSEVAKGVEALTLMDTSGEVRVTATQVGGYKAVAAH